MMHGHGKSDRPIVPAKPPNEAEPEAKEAVEGRGLAKGNLLKRNMIRTLSRQSMSSALERYAKQERELGVSGTIILKLWYALAL
jgi:hypothetical protein